MNPISKARNVLRAVKQKWGSSAAKRHLWDEEYGTGRWDHCDHSPGARVYDYIEKYAREGDILDLGCGSGNTAAEIDGDQYRSYTGIDISEIALKKARARSQELGRSAKNQFLQSDIISVTPATKYDVILFRESIYYVPSRRIKAVLDHYKKYLTDKGVVIVNVGEHATKNARLILEVIVENYQVVEKYAPAGEREFIAVFR